MYYRPIVLIAFAVLIPAVAGAQTATSATTSVANMPPAAHAPYTTSDTELGTLLDDPAAKAILVKRVPELVNNDQIDQARGMTLQALQPYAGEALNDDMLKKIDADFAALPKSK